MSNWKHIKHALKGATPDKPFRVHWILGINSIGEQKVIRWTIEYPKTKGCWMVHYIPTDYIDGIKEFYPIAFKELDQPDMEFIKNLK